MDQHPIPQDVTGFQFKLIGSMTVKQFGYVAAGVVMAVILYYLPMNTPFAILIKLFLIPIVGASGVVVAFVPIDGRPIDIMTTNFVKALFAPNQYIYRHQGRKMSFSTVTTVKPVAATTAAQKAGGSVPSASPNSSQLQDKEAKLRAFLMSSQGGVKNDLDKKEDTFLKAFTPVTPTGARPTVTPAPKPTLPAIPVAKPTIATPNIAPKVAVAPAPIVPSAPKPTPHSVAAAPGLPPAPQPENKETAESLAQKEMQLTQALAQAKQEEAKPLPQADHDAAHIKVEELAKQIADIHSQKVQLEQELAKLKTQLSEQKNPAQPITAAPAVSPDAAPAPAPLPAANAIPVQDPKLVKVVQKDTAVKKTDLPKVSDTPNVVVGIVKDPRGNVLSNILVEVKDKNGNPVRAFKTNPLGQFASATPLSPGVYTIELEDPKGQNNFDVIQITANNEIMRPIEILSHDAREALRQQLFSQ
jgi:hypothetical protein